MYIRTKDGRVYNLESKEMSSWEYIDNDTAINEYGVECAFYTIYYFDENKGHYSEYDGKGGHSCDFIEEKDILKQSENLEDLCDCFVIDWLPTNHKDIFAIDKYSKEVVKSCIGNNKTKVYGVIWVQGEGLIYVAKMNSEGKFVLI